MKKDHRKIIYQILSFLIPFIVYVITLAPSVTFIDAGELATVATKLGVAHPTGYPLFTVLGNLFTNIPIGDEIYRLNLMSAVVSSLALLMFFNLLIFIFKELNLSEELNSVKNNISDEVIYNISLASVFILAFSKTFWDTANAIEVYSLHTFFLVTNIYLFLKANSFNPKENDLENQREKKWLLFAFVLGLSFTNHLSTIFLSVGFLYLYFAVNGFNKISFKRILILSIPFLLGYSVYLYLFVRAENSVISWGYPNNFENFWRHFTGKQFSIWMFSSFENAGKQFSYFTTNYPLEFFYIPLLIAVPGLYEISKKSKKLFYFTILLFGFCILYAINYDIYDIDSYFLLAFIVTAIWAAFGFLFLVKKFKDSKAISFAIILTCLIPLSQNYSKVDKSKSYFVEDYTINIFNTAPENSIIITSQWDFFISSSLYQQFVKNIRPDIIIIDKELMRKTWYMHYLQIHYPDIYEKSKSEFEIYHIELLKFEINSERYMTPKTETDTQDLRKIKTAFMNLLNSIVDENYPDREIFTTFEIEDNKDETFGKNYMKIPQGLLVKYSKDKSYTEYKYPDYKFTITENTDYHHSFIMNAYYKALLFRANYDMNFARFDEAEMLISKSAEIKPNSQETKQMMQKLNQLRALPDK